MQPAELQDELVESALEELQTRRLEGKSVSGEEVVEAVNRQIEGRRQISIPLLQQCISSKKIVGRKHLTQIGKLLSDTISQWQDLDPNLLASYSSGLTVCAGELQKRGADLSIA